MLVIWLVNHFGPDRNIWTYIECIGMQFCTDISDPQSYLIDLGDPWLFILRHHEIDILAQS